ncbi:MAG: hypothetical protein IH825_01150, partial [Candidatus Marinimicrobia bacterium]|nr:hypothetical protein [Candidatus Neomarinimicrobiota bacterium]
MKSSNITNNEINLPELELLHAIGGLADEKGIEVYLVGGAVRDAMLSKTNFDLDIVVVSDGIKFARQMKKTLNADSIVAWEKFGTAELIKGNLKIEVATARSEEYIKSSRKPTVEPADIHTD